MSATRVGLGYDIHRLAPDRRLILGGVTIEHPKGLVGHSDGDVLLHALMDALLGAAGLGDIGGHFPSEDPAHAGADSLVLLAQVGKLVADAGYRPVSLDATVVAEEPRLSGHVGAMRAAIGQALGLESSAVSVKATTNERLGPVGNGQAIAAMAVALIEANE